MQRYKHAGNGWIRLATECTGTMRCSQGFGSRFCRRATDRCIKI